MNDFSVWLLNELESRGWRSVDLATEAKLTKGTVSNILNGNRNPGWDACLSIANALQIPPEDVFKRAGLLPGRREPTDDLLFEELKEAARHLNTDELKNAIEYLRWRYRQQEAQKK